MDSEGRAELDRLGAVIEALRTENESLRADRGRAEVYEGPDPALVATAENSPDFVSLVDLDGVIRYINRVWPTDKMENILGSTVYDHIDPRYHATVRKTYETVLRTRAPGRYESEVHHPVYGTTYWESRVGAVVRGGEVVGFSVISRNVTEQRLAQADEERFFRLSLDMLCVATFDGYFRRCNPAFTRLLGFDMDEMLSRPIVSFVHPEDVARTQRAFETLFSGRPVIDFENRYFHRDGGTRWLSWRAITDQDEIIAVARDVTEHKILEAQLRQSQKLEAVGQLAGGIAHDFNNLVLAIQANAHITLEQLPPGQPSREHLEQILRATSRASDLTRQVLAFGRSEPLREIPFDLNVVLEEARPLIDDLLPPGIVVEVRTHGETAPVIRGDPSQVGQVLMNLCLNARDAMPAGGAIRVETWSESDPDHPDRGLAVLSVEDEGEGMTEETREHLFEPFFTTKEPGRGTGLGLATVYAIVRQHGGCIEVKAEEGRGSAFVLRFPMAIGETPQQIQAPEHGTHAYGVETILVAEDEDLVRRVLRKILEGAGYELIVARDGREAIDLFRGHRDRIDLVLLDHVMPGKTGIEVLRAIRAEGSDVPVIISSGFRKGERSDDDPCVEPDAFLEKPYQPPQLLGEIRRFLDDRSE